MNADLRKSAFICGLTNSLYLPDLFGEDGHRFKQLTDNSVIRDVEDRRLGIFVDRYDRSGILHAHEVLDRAAE